MSLIVWNADENFIAYYGSFIFIFFLIATAPFIKFQSLVLVLLFFVLLLLITEGQLRNQDLFKAFQSTLIFAGLIPTMGLVRAAGLQLESVKQSQNRLAKLEGRLIEPGFQITAHFFGAVINTGVFVILASALPKDSDYNYRRRAAEAALRGMSSSATWSPFFVAFVVGQIYLDNFSTWMGLAIGISTGISFLIFSLIPICKKDFLYHLGFSINCLFPVMPILILTMFSVIILALIFSLTALSAIILVMPILVIIFLFKNYKKIRPVAIDTVTYLKSTTDDVVVISTAMLVGLLITKDPESLNTMLALNIFEIPDWCVLIFIPTCMATMSLIGIHPLITSTVLLSIYANSEIQINEALIMQAHLIGWCTGTMSSIASLSVISCSRLFKTKSSSLCFGQNTIMTLLFAFFGGSFLSLIDFLLKLWS